MYIIGGGGRQSLLILLKIIIITCNINTGDLGIIVSGGDGDPRVCIG